MSYYNYSDNSGELNGNNRDPRLTSSIAQYQNNMSDSAQAQHSVYTYNSSTNHQHYHTAQVYPTTADQTYTNTPNTPSDSSNYPYYSAQSYYSQEYQSTQQNQSYPSESCQLAYSTPNYDQQQYYQPTVDAQYNQTGQQNQHYVYDLSFPDEVDQEQDVTARSDEELWVEAWLARLGKIQIKLDSTVVVTNSKSCPSSAQIAKTAAKQRKVASIKLGDARANLRKAFAVLSSIETIHKRLSDSLATLSSDEWRQCTVQIGTLRDELSVLMTPFEGDSAACLKRLMGQRRKKRCNEKRRRSTRKEEREKRKDERTKRHERIDGWLEKEKMEVQRMQEEEEAKHEADNILAETTRKKLDAKRNLALVQALTKLRGVREKAASGRGEQISAQDTYAFQNLAERLQDIWTNALKDYGREEHRLRTQLEQTTSEDQRKAKLEREQKVTDDWSKALFGEPLKEGEESGLYLGLTAAERSVDTFIAIRKSWDTFLAKSSDVLGSKIPIGWVLPKEHVSDKWSQYISNTT